MPTSAQRQSTSLRVEVAFATPRRQALISVSLPAGATVAEAIRESGISREFPDFDLAEAPVGVWGERVDGGRRLNDGDRVELYRPLPIDPREARRRLAANGHTMGRTLGPTGDA